jgi:replicative DNA helicase
MINFFEESIKRKENTLIAARPSNGKVGWTITKLMHMTKENTHVLAFSLEASKRQYEYMGKNHQQRDLSNWTIHDLTTIKPEEIKDIFLQTNDSRRVDVLYIDNIDSLPLTKKSDYHNALQLLSELCSEHNISLVVGIQLPNAIDKRENKRPLFSDIKLNKTTYHFFENVVGLYRDEVYQPNENNNNQIEVLLFKTNAELESYEEYYSIR